VKGNCFPIDSRVRKVLAAYGLPDDEQCLVSLCLSQRRNTREIARIFYQAGGSEPPSAPMLSCGNV